MDGCVQCSPLISTEMANLKYCWVRPINSSTCLISEGQLIDKYDMRNPVHTISAADIDGDGHVEIVVGTDGKDLAAITYDPN